MAFIKTPITLLLLLVATGSQAFVTSKISQRSNSIELSAESPVGRRAFLAGGAFSLVAGAVAPPALADQTKEFRQGIEVNAFNGLIFNYRGGEYGGLDSEDLTEPSVPYQEFNQRLRAGEVSFVEFLAPDGDAAYVTFKAKDGELAPTPIRIGEGYPIEQHDGYSSPMFCVRAVKNAGVPYKFTVPGLEKFKTTQTKTTYP